MNFDQAQSLMPPGWSLWGNFGDGKWRAGHGDQANLIEPAATLDLAVERAREAARSIGPVSINESTARYQLAAFSASQSGAKPGSHAWWNAIRGEMRAHHET